MSKPKQKACPVYNDDGEAWGCELQEIPHKVHAAFVDWEHFAKTGEYRRGQWNLRCWGADGKKVSPVPLVSEQEIQDAIESIRNTLKGRT